MIKLAVSGACGKMGSRIISLAKRDKDVEIVIGLERKGHPAISSDIDGIRISDDDDLISQADCLVEFTESNATLAHLNKCVSLKKPIVIGTTGFDEKGFKLIEEASKHIPILFSPNMSVGVNLLFKLVKEAVSILKKYNVKIIETHHVHKKDAPSGTAKKIAQIIESVNDRKVKDIESIRKGEIVGEHEIIFDSELDTVVLKHSAKTRDIFATGALLAAKWIVSQKPGLYSMEDCL
ncbi:MAG: 4-hydroxy-tetrahydrodipicolinate reductase [Candidatus Omnitrophota bacterium]